MRKRLIILPALVVVLSGCVLGPDGRLVGAGGGSYEYSRTMPDGSSCTVSVVSGRDVLGGVLEIDKDCRVVSRVDSTRGAVEALQVVGASISAVREAVSKVP